VGSYSINYNHDLLTKNLNADRTNPIVYNESLKEEHVYDEIKHKEGYKDPGMSLDFYTGRLSNFTINYVLYICTHYGMNQWKYIARFCFPRVSQC